MKLFVGLGNPGKEYEGTRHNCGFITIDKFAKKCGVNFDHEQFNGTYCKFNNDGETIYLLKPLTYMNNSGECVQAFAHYYKIPVEDIVVVFDDMALKPGVIRLRLNGSSGGQKGMKSIIDHFSTENIKRIRVGIGEPVYNSIDFVLGKPDEAERKLIDEATDRASDALNEIMKSNFVIATSRFSGGGKS